MAVFQFGALGELEARVLSPQERAAQFDGAVALSVRTQGAAPGQVGLVAGIEAAATVVGEGDVLERWEPLMASIVAVLTDLAGDLEPQDVKELAPGAGNGPALDPDAISIGLFLGEQLLAAIGFVVDQAEAATPMPVFQTLVDGDTATVEMRRMRLLSDVEMGVSVELDKAAGAPVDVLVNGTLMARGEVVVIDEEYAVRISEIVTPEKDSRRGA
mgnify:CR=1 FL=1